MVMAFPFRVSGAHLSTAGTRWCRPCRRNPTQTSSAPGTLSSRAARAMALRREDCMEFDFTPLLANGLPPAAVRWTGLAKYNFTGGNNDADEVPIDDLIAAATASLKRDGRKLATYNVGTGPQGYRPLREFLVTKLKRDAGIECTADDILLVSGSSPGLDLVNGALLARGDTVICEKDNYQSSLT